MAWEYLLNTKDFQHHFSFQRIPDYNSEHESLRESHSSGSTMPKDWVPSWGLGDPGFTTDAQYGPLINAVHPGGKKSVILMLQMSTVAISVECCIKRFYGLPNIHYCEHWTQKMLISFCLGDTWIFVLGCPQGSFSIPQPWSETDMFIYRHFNILQFFSIAL